MNIKKASLLLVLIAIATSLSAQNSTSEVKKDGLLGNVRQVTSRLYEAQLVGEDELKKGSNLEHLETVYASNGQRRNMTFLSTEEDIVFRTRYKHDAFGQTTLEQIVDNNEQVIGRTYYIYNDNFVLTESYVEDAERQVENRIRYKYDENGRLQQRSYNDPLNEVYRREVYYYNMAGNIAKTVVYSRQNKKMQEIRYEYDAHRQPISKTLYDYSEEEPEVFMTLYLYQYDSHGNWVQKTEYTVDSDRRIPEYITERNIEYF